MPTALERDAGETTLDHVAAEHRDGPRRVRAVEHREVRVETGRKWGHAEGPRASVTAPAAREVELDERTARQSSGAFIRERHAKEARFEYREHGPELQLGQVVEPPPHFAR